MDKQILVDLVRGNPAYQQAITQMEQKFANQPISSGDINGLIKFLEAAVDHPEHYDKLRAAAIMDGKLDQDTLPPQFNPQIIISLLIALYGLRDRVHGKEQQPNQGMMQPPQQPMQQPMPQQQGLAHGGLAGAAHHIQAAGRGGDTMLAHINPREAAMLKNMGASGSINPHTGLPEFGWSWKSIVSTVLPAAISYFSPVVGNYLGSSFGTAGKIAGTALAAGALGAGAAKLTGGNPLTEGLKAGTLGALNVGAGSELGKVIGLENPIAASAAGGALIGGGMNALTHGDIMAGALQGGIGGALSAAGPKLSGKLSANSPNLARGINVAAQTGGNMLTAGYDPSQAITSAGLAGIAAGLRNPSPSDQAVQQTADQQSNNQPAKDTLGQTPPATGSVPPAGDKSMDWGTLGLLGLGGVAAASMLGGNSNKIQQAVATSPKLSTEQQQYMSKPLTTLDWDTLAVNAAKDGVDVATYTALHWNDVSNGKYNITQPVQKAQGGLSKIAYLAQGSGYGRDDTIDARLSDGEYVVDAETVALLGDGSTKAGALKLDKMRAELRKQKGKKLAKGEFSTAAKSPLDYMRGAR
jgi:hypothetical protein